MFKSIIIIFTAATLAPVFAGAAALTELETKWIKAGEPVLAYARQLKLPVDIIVQPQARPNDVPLAMGFMDGRCKLVISMRGNPNAESILKGVPDADHAILIEAMTAHEIAHCWRYAQGVWHKLPSGFEEVTSETSDDEELLALSRTMRENRREEGFSDLVALAWTKREHPAHYARVHAWMERVRADQPVAHGTHDTRVWVRMAKDSRVIGHGANAFDDVLSAWGQGLTAND